MPPSELLKLIQRYADGLATKVETSQLEQQLQEDATARRLFRSYLELDSALERIGSAAAASVFSSEAFNETTFDRESTHKNTLSPHAMIRPGTSRMRFWMPLTVTGVILLMVGLALLDHGSSQAWATIIDAGPGATIVRDGLSRAARSGDVLRKGELLQANDMDESPSASTRIRFTSGADVTLLGVSALKPLTGNSAYLAFGQVSALAQAPQSKGFTLFTKTSQIVDVGTSFVAAVTPDGQSRVDVSDGTVQVRLKGGLATHQLNSGEALCVEPGTRQIITRIESGDQTTDFRFPTIEPPSNADYADAAQGHATIQVLRGELLQGKGASGPVSVLLDGRGQTHEDAPEDSSFFQNDATGSFLLDLGQVVSISKINSYSWHQNTTHDWQRHRAVQKFTLYGFAGERPPAAEMDHEQAGWVRIARIDSDDYFRVRELLERPAQQACSITSAGGEIGRFRYLLWEVEPTLIMPLRHLNNTFYGEFDVFAEIISDPSH